MCIDTERFERARGRVIGIERQRLGIGTLSEKTVHAVLKNYYAPDEDMHEIPIENFVADIFDGEAVIEIQTRSFQNMRRKLAAFLPLYPVTIVYPIPHVKWLHWMDEETGEISPGRKSPKKGNAYQAFIELYKIRPFLKDPNLRLRLDLIDMEEYRLLNGWSKDKKKGSTRYDRIPIQLVELIYLMTEEDYRAIIPNTLPKKFTSKEFSKAVHISLSSAQRALLILYQLGVVQRVEKQKNAYIYELTEL